MPDCLLSYIPERLTNSDDRKNIDEFHLSDILYRRVTDKLLENPFGTISLVDLSHNIGVCGDEEISKKRDVLFSIREDEDFQAYNQEVISLKIISLNDQKRYDKLFPCSKRADLKVRVLLSHAPVPCMYPHAVFRFFIFDAENREVEVTFLNYEKTLGKKKRYKYLRTELRQELAKMIIRKEISYK